MGRGVSVTYLPLRTPLTSLSDHLEMVIKLWLLWYYVYDTWNII